MRKDDRRIPDVSDWTQEERDWLEQISGRPITDVEDYHSPTGAIVLFVVVTILMIAAGFVLMGKIGG